MIYSLLLINAVCTFLAYINKGKFMSWSIGLLCLFLGLRYNFGNDYMAYYRGFNMSFMEARSFGTEIGYAFLCEIFRPFGFFSMQIFLACGFCMVLYHSLKRYVAPQYYWLVIFSIISNADLIFFGASAVRQTAAFTCVLLSMPFLEKKKILPYMGLTLLATSFHMSAILFVLLYFLIYVDFRKKTNLTILIITSLAVATVLKTFFYSYLSSFTEQNFEKYYQRYGDNDTAIGGGEIGVVIRIIVLVFFVFAMKASSSTLSDRIRNVFMVMGFAGVIIFTMREQVMLQRYCMYFSYFFCFAYSTVLERGCKIGKNKFDQLFIALIVLWDVYMALKFADGNKLFEYHTIFEA